MGEIVNFEVEFNNRVREKLSAMDNPIELDETWFPQALIALSFASPLSMGITGQGFSSLVTKLQSGLALNAFEFAILNNNIEARTRKELDIDMDGYCALMTACNEYSDQFNTTSHEIKDVILAEIQNETKKNGMKRVQ